MDFPSAMIDLFPPILEVEITYAPRGGANALFHCRDMRVLMDGPAGTGKTRAILERIVWLCEKYPGSRHWIGRETRESMTESVLVTLENKVLWPGHPALVGPHRSQRQSYKFPNGSTIVVGGLDKPEKTFSAEYDTVSVFEAVECSANDLELLLRTLRNNVLPFQQQVLDTNPGPFTHHLNQSCNAGAITRILSRHEDNPELWRGGQWTENGARYIHMLDQLTGARKERLRYGRWVNAEGVVYDGFDAAVHIIDEMPKGWEQWPKYRSIDFGFTNPFVCQWWALDPDGRLYLYREIYKTHRIVGGEPNGDDHATNIRRLSEGEAIEATIADTDAEDRATLLAHSVETIAAKKEIRRGLDAVAARLRVVGDGKPRLFILRSSLVERDELLAETKKPLCTADEFDCYLWVKDTDGKPVKEEPAKVNDHGCLVAGTLVATEDGFTPIEIVKPGDLVRTRWGWSPVQWWGMTDDFAHVFTVEFSNGWRLTGTGDHPVFVDNFGFVRLDGLRYGDTVLSWESQSRWSSAASASVGTLAQSSGPTACTSSQESRTASAASEGSTKRYGRPITDLSRDCTRYTTATETRSTTTSAIWNAYRSRLTLTSTEINLRYEHRKQLLGSLTFARTLPRGMEHQRDGGGIQNTGNGDGRPDRFLSGPASLAGRVSNLEGLEPRSARRPVVRGIDGRWEPTTSGASALCAGMPTNATDTLPSEHVRVSVVRVYAQTARRPVFNLKIDGPPEFYANGILVHNCDAMRYMVMHLDGGLPASVAFVGHADTTPPMTPHDMTQGNVGKPQSTLLAEMQAEEARLVANMFGGRG